jgi:hypothetical protein
MHRCPQPGFSRASRRAADRDGRYDARVRSGNCLERIIGHGLWNRRGSGRSGSPPMKPAAVQQPVSTITAEPPCCSRCGLVLRTCNTEADPEQARDPHLAGVLVDPDLGELGAEGVHGVSRGVGVARHVRGDFKPSGGTVPPCWDSRRSRSWRAASTIDEPQQLIPDEKPAAEAGRRAVNGFGVRHPRGTPADTHRLSACVRAPIRSVAEPRGRARQRRDSGCGGRETNHPRRRALHPHQREATVDGVDQRGQAQAQPDAGDVRRPSGRLQRRLFRDDQAMTKSEATATTRRTGHRRAASPSAAWACRVGGGEDLVSDLPRLRDQGEV